ncbi:MAG TPA: hypothetical protein VK473_17145 [Terriglobales bacterium]|nr:hypothetical protein [Terriglobales bacterium]
MENYFNYFTEVEERFQQRRGTGLLLSTLDWALIETWKDAGIPLEAVIRGIDSAFDRYDQRPTKTRKVNSLAYCAQEVLAAAEEMKEAAGGTVLQAESSSRVETGFELPRVAEFLRRNADQLQQAELPGNVRDLAMETACHLRRIAGDLENQGGRLEDLERRLSVMEEKVHASLLTLTNDDEMVALRAEADRELAPYRRQMPGMQIDQLQKQFIHKRLMERYRIPRLSLFYL